MAAQGVVQFSWQLWDSSAIFYSAQAYKWQLRVGYNFGGSSGIVMAYCSAAFLSGSSRWGTILVAAVG